MKKPITPFAHGVLDYATVAALAAVPSLLRFPKPAARAAYVLAGGYAGLSALTDYPLAVKRAVPFKAHGATELVIGALLPALPMLLGFKHDRRASSVFYGLTGMTLAVALLTDWDKDSERVARRNHRRKPRLVRAA
jgi:hypothetical protein